MASRILSGMRTSMWDREQDCKMQLEGDSGVRVGLDAEMLVT